MRMRSVTMVWLAGVAAMAAADAEVIGWRGDGSGCYPDAKPATEWSKSVNVIWSTNTVDWSNASPVPVGDRVFICTERAELLCLSAADGRVLWRRTNDYADLLSAEDAAKLADGARLQKDATDIAERMKRAPWDLGVYTDMAAFCKKVLDDPDNKARLDLVKEYQDPPKHGMTGYSTPTPVSDGNRVYVLTGLGTVACYTLDGERVWLKATARPRNGWGHSASPLLVDGKLIVHVGDELAALDAATGESVWSSRGRSVWGTPLLVKAGDETAVYTTGGDLFRVRDGQRLAANSAAMPWTSPVADGGTIYVVDEGGAAALGIPDDAAGDEVTLEKEWEMSPPRNRYYASPVVHDGLIYAVHQAGELTVIDSIDGSVVYSRKLDLGGTVYPSLCVAGGYVFVSSDSGKTVVIEPGREYEEIGRNELEPFRSCPVFDGNRMYVRTLSGLYCIGKTAGD
jgi:hypothetical protein